MPPHSVAVEQLALELYPLKQEMNHSSSVLRNVLSTVEPYHTVLQIKEWPLEQLRSGHVTVIIAHTMNRI